MVPKQFVLRSKGVEFDPFRIETKKTPADSVPAMQGPNHRGLLVWDFPFQYPLCGDRSFQYHLSIVLHDVEEIHRSSLQISSMLVVHFANVGKMGGIRSD